jgi:hypothetical protein
MRSLGLRRLLRPAPAPAAPRERPGPDRSALLAELEVRVPAPERIVRWETATTTCETCTEPVARGAIRCRHCGATLPPPVLREPTDSAAAQSHVV